MKKLSAIEWQSFSLKKDVEKISKKLYAKNDIQITMLFQIAFVVFGAALPNIFVGIAKQQYFWIILTLASLSLIIRLAIVWIIKKIKENKPGSDRMSTRDFIDMFDNEIAYYVLTSESYYTMLNEAIQHRGEDDKELIGFYFIEASYYFNKAVADLVPISNIAIKVLSTDIDMIAKKRLISLARYKNVKNLLLVIYNYLEKHKSVIEDGDIIIKLNKYFKDVLEDIDETVSKSHEH